MATFIQSTFNEISLERDQELWLSADDSRLEDRLRLLSEFPQCRFRHQLSEGAPAVRLCRKNPKLSGALREKGNLSYAQGDPDAALQFYNQTLQFADADNGETALVFGNRDQIRKRNIRSRFTTLRKMNYFYIHISYIHLQSNPLKGSAGFVHLHLNE